MRGEVSNVIDAKPEMLRSHSIVLLLPLLDQPVKPFQAVRRAGVDQPSRRSSHAISSSNTGLTVQTSARLGQAEVFQAAEVRK